MAACSMENQTPVWKSEWRTWVHDQEIGSGKYAIRRFFPRLCNHCDNPPCMTVCPTGATYQLDTGIVMVDESRCMGCGACAMACPYQARYNITYDDIDKGQAFFGSDAWRNNPSVDKCDFCAHRVDKGQEPACVETCVGSARLFGDLDDPDDPITRFVKGNIARPLMPYIGTRPNVYYIDDLKRKG
jgi:Fe-S-cluster-containing dehydrogenase component